MSRDFITGHSVRVLIVCVMLLAASVGHGQTYFHDDQYMAQWMAKEGFPLHALTPTIYYDFLHKNYAGSALVTGSFLISRTPTNLSMMPTVEYADSVEQKLKKRGEAELWNFTDRQAYTMDVAYITERVKVESALERLRDNISRISQYGGTPMMKQLWQARFDCITSTLDGIREAYMPIATRKEQYMKIYIDAVAKNRQLSKELQILIACKKSQYEQKLTAKIKEPDMHVICTNAYANWKSSWGGK